jgi:proteasome lid subunit RPN8/RPN11
VIISTQVLDDVVAHARERQPSECCGVLIGQGDRITAAIRTRNVAESPTRFLIDPEDHFDARRTARAQGLDVIGFYHSHPHSRAYPSPIDLAESAYPDVVHLIIGLRDQQRPEIRLFKLTGSIVEELALTQDRGDGKS